MRAPSGSACQHHGFPEVEKLRVLMYFFCSLSSCALHTLDLDHSLHYWVAWCVWYQLLGGPLRVRVDPLTIVSSANFVVSRELTNNVAVKRARLLLLL